LEQKLPLDEVNNWGLKRVYDVNDMLNMKADYDNAINSYQSKKMEELQN